MICKMQHKTKIKNSIISDVVKMKDGSNNTSQIAQIK